MKAGLPITLQKGKYINYTNLYEYIVAGDTDRRAWEGKGVSFLVSHLASGRFNKLLFIKILIMPDSISNRYGPWYKGQSQFGD